MFARIEAFRRRRPRLRDEVVTLAHGAGGKASAALLDAVFLPAFAPHPSPTPTPTPPTPPPPAPTDRRRRARPAHGRAPRLQHRLLRREAAALPRRLGRHAGRARHDQRPRHDGGAADRHLRRLRARGGPVDRGPARGRGRHGRGRRRGRASPSSPATPRWSTAAPPTACTSPPPASASSPPAATWRRPTVAAGDVVLASGTMGDHGMAVMLARGDLALEADIASDTAPLHGLVEDLLAAAPATRWLRDSTRGGVGTVCNELARDANVTVVLDEPLLPVRPAVAAACELLGIDPLYVANEGKLVAIVPPEEADAALAALARPPLRSRGGAHRRDPRRAARHRRAAHRHGRDPHRRHARRRPAAPHLLTGPFVRSSCRGSASGVATRFSAEGHSGIRRTHTTRWPATLSLRARAHYESRRPCPGDVRRSRRPAARFHQPPAPGCPPSVRPNPMPAVQGCTAGPGAGRAACSPIRRTRRDRKPNRCGPSSETLRTSAAPRALPRRPGVCDSPRGQRQDGIWSDRNGSVHMTREVDAEKR